MYSALIHGTSLPLNGKSCKSRNITATDNRIHTLLMNRSIYHLLLCCNTVHLHNTLPCLSITTTYLPPQALNGLSDYNFYLLVWARDRAVIRAQCSLALRIREVNIFAAHSQWSRKAKAAPGQKHTEMFIPTGNLPCTLLPLRIRPQVTVAKPFKCRWLSVHY